MLALERPSNWAGRRALSLTVAVTDSGGILVDSMRSDCQVL